MTRPLPIADNKRGFVALLDDACRLREPPIEDEDRASRLRALAGACELSSNTLVSAVQRTTDPHLDTLVALARKTPVPLTSWLLSLALIDADDIARGLARNGRPDLLTEQQLRALALVDGLSDEQAFDFLAVCEHIRHFLNTAAASLFRRGRRGGLS